MIVKILVDAGASPAEAARAAVVLDAGGSVAEALEVMGPADVFLPEFRPEMLICREDGGGGNRTRVTCPADSPLSSASSLAPSDDEPRPQLVALKVGA